MERKLDLILSEIQQLNSRVTNLEHNMATKGDLNDLRQTTKDDLNDLRKLMATKDDLNDIRQVMATKDDLNDIRQFMATKDDVADIKFIKQAVIETNLVVKQILEDQKSINEILGEHEVSIRSLRRKPV